MNTCRCPKVRGEQSIDHAHAVGTTVKRRKKTRSLLIPILFTKWSQKRPNDVSSLSRTVSVYSANALKRSLCKLEKWSIGFVFDCFCDLLCVIEKFLFVWINFNTFAVFFYVGAGSKPCLRKLRAFFRIVISII